MPDCVAMYLLACSMFWFNVSSVVKTLCHRSLCPSNDNPADGQSSILKVLAFISSTGLVKLTFSVILWDFSFLTLCLINICSILFSPLIGLWWQALCSLSLFCVLLYVLCKLFSSFGLYFTVLMYGTVFAIASWHVSPSLYHLLSHWMGLHQIWYWWLFYLVINVTEDNVFWETEFTS